MSVILVFGAFTIVYSLIAGLFAVAYNDVLQFVILIGGNLLFGLLLVSRAGGLSHMFAQVTAFRGAQFLSAVPSGSSLSGVTLLALCVQGLFFAGSPFAGEGWTAQRFMAARNERHAILGQMANGVLALAVRLIPFIVIALAAAALLPVNTVSVPASLWGDLVRQYAPPGLFGLLLVSSLAGYMAAISSIGNWAASYIVNDVYKRSVRPKATQKEFVLVSRIVTGALLAIAFLWGGLIHPEQLDKWILFINSALIVFSLPLAWLKWFWWRTNAIGDMVGVLGGFPAGYLVWFGSDSVLAKGVRTALGHATGWNWNGIVPAFGDLDRFPFWVGFAILFVLGWIAILAATLLTKPEPMNVLEDFYRSARPIGIWGPVRRSLASKGREPKVDEFGRDLSASAWGILFYFSLCVGLFSAMGDEFFKPVQDFRFPLERLFICTQSHGTAVRPFSLTLLLVIERFSSYEDHRRYRDSDFTRRQSKTCNRKRCRAHPESHYLVITIQTDEGLVGYGEATVAPGWSGENQGTALALIQQMLAKALVGADPMQTNMLVDRMDRMLIGNPFTKAAIEIALLDLKKGRSWAFLYMLLGGARRPSKNTFKVLN